MTTTYGINRAIPTLKSNISKPCWPRWRFVPDDSSGIPGVDGR
jgi:hypothetical protein